MLFLLSKSDALFNVAYIDVFCGMSSALFMANLLRELSLYCDRKAWTKSKMPSQTRMYNYSAWYFIQSIVNIFTALINIGISLSNYWYIVQYMYNRTHTVSTLRYMLPRHSFIVYFFYTDNNYTSLSLYMYGIKLHTGDLISTIYNIVLKGKQGTLLGGAIPSFRCWTKLDRKSNIE